MRLLYFTNNNSDHNRRFLHKLAHSSHEIFYLSLAGAPRNEWLPDGIRLVRCKWTSTPHAPPAALKSFLPELQRVLANLRPDLVQAGPVQSCAYLAALANAHPCLAMCWGSDILVDTDRDLQWREATITALNGADGLFCDCNTVRDRARHLAPCAVNYVVQFPWGVQIGVFGPNGSKVALPWDVDDFILICTRSWEPRYDIDVLLHAFARAQAENSRLKLLLIGSGSREEGIRSFVRDYHLFEKVIVQGQTAASDMPKYFRSASAYISCTPSDGTSISLLEAMATGLPAIVADNSSNREWLREGINGWFGEVGNSSSFADRIAEVVALSSAARSNAADLSQAIVSERADWDKNFPLLLQAYDTLLNSHRLK
jgi:glycosyltransferase involved in cell wall biosynthesis